jgi:hypothetical protein
MSWGFSPFSALPRFGWFEHIGANFAVFDASAPDEEIGGPFLGEGLSGPAFGFGLASFSGSSLQAGFCC